MHRRRLAFLASALVLAASTAGCLGDDDVPAAEEPVVDEPSRVTRVVLEAPGPAADGSVEFCWNVQGAGVVPHVALHWDVVSHAEDATRTFASYGAGLAWPDNAPGADPSGYEVPGRFCAEVALPPAGARYVVAHAMAEDGPPGVLSGEAVVSAPPPVIRVDSVEIVAAPDEALAAAEPVVCFLARGVGVVPHAALRWSTESRADDAERTFSDYAGVRYPGNATGADPAGYALTPEGARFCATVGPMPQTGALHVVAHVVDAAGPPGLLSAERAIRVPTSPTEATLEIRDSTFVPAEFKVAPGAVITVRNHDHAKHTVKSDRMPGFDSRDVGGSSSKTFVAPERPGTYGFHCIYHGTMKGTLVVAEQ